MVYVNLFGVKCNRRDNFPQGNDNLLGDLGRLPWAVRRDTGTPIETTIDQRTLNVSSKKLPTFNIHCSIVIYGFAGPLSASDKPRKNFLPLANTMFLPTARVDPSFA